MSVHISPEYPENTHIMPFMRLRTSESNLTSSVVKTNFVFYMIDSANECANVSTVFACIGSQMYLVVPPI